MKLSERQISFIEEHQGEDVGKLALLYGGKGSKGDCALEGEELRFALMQIEARERLKEKLPTILEKREFVFPTRISTEQASSEVTAALKGEIVGGLRTEDKGLRTEGLISADLTGGLGVDTIFMARGSKRHHYVEINPEHSAAAEVNLPLFLDNVVVHNTDAESFMKETDEEFDFVYADPARRSESNSKVFRLEECVPNILELKPLIMSKSRWLIVKLSPMLDITQAIEKLGAEKVVVVSVNDECKEMIVVCGRELGKACEIVAVEIGKKGRWVERMRMGEEEIDGADRTDRPDMPDNPDRPDMPDEPDRTDGTDGGRDGIVERGDWGKEGMYGVPKVGMMMYEPYAAMMKAGAVKDTAAKYGMFEYLAVKYGMKRVAPSSHLFFAEGRRNFPGREFVVKEVSLFGKSTMKGIKKANITVRNFPMSVAEVRKRFGVGDGGEVYLFLTTDSLGNKLAIRCGKV